MENNDVKAKEKGQHEILQTDVCMNVGLQLSGILLNEYAIENFTNSVRNLINN